jgi:hypothetical protein
MKRTSARRRPQPSPATELVDQVDLPPPRRLGGPEPIRHWRMILLREPRRPQQ